MVDLNFVVARIVNGWGLVDVIQEPTRRIIGQGRHRIEKQNRLSVKPIRRYLINSRRSLGEGLTCQRVRNWARERPIPLVLSRIRSANNIADMLDRPLLAPEEECFLPVGVVVSRDKDWATDGISENILLEGVLGPAEVIAGIQCVIAKIFVSSPVEGAGTRFCLQKQHIRAIQSVLRAEVVLQNLDFLNGVGVGRDRSLVHTTRVHVPDSVKIVLCSRYPQPVYGDRVLGEEPTLVERSVGR